MQSSNAVYWITGLSGAGKTTLCRRLVAHLRASERPVVMLDGDELRAILGAEDLHTVEQRRQLAMCYARLCRSIAAQGMDVAIATISLFREVHEWNRNNIPGYVEIYLQVPKEELLRRDPKKIYQRAARDDLQHVAGFDVAVDEPQAPDVRIDWLAGMTEADTLAQVIEQLNLKL